MGSKIPRKDKRADWPYATSYLLETLDPELIEAHAAHILSRSLNIGRAVGFIGAGVAMSYGRISWQTLVRTELARVTAKMEKVKAKYPDLWESAKAEDVRRLASTLDTLKLSRTDIRSERYPMLFQVSEQLDRALNAFLGSPNAMGLRAHASMLTVDDVGHAYQLLFDALCFGQPRQPEALAIRRDKEGAAYEFIETVLGGHCQPGLLDRAFINSSELEEITATKPIDTSAYRLFFATEFIQDELLKAVADTLTEPLRTALVGAVTIACTKRPADYERGLESAQTRRYLLPTDRYLVNVLLHLASREEENPWKLPARSWWERIGDEVGHFRSPPPKIAMTTRHGLVTQWRDPLLFMQERLRINRFITTNFDSEIERLFDDQSFRERSSKGQKESLLRPAFIDIVFDNSKSGELTAFAVRDRSLTGAVVHLHGRAERNIAEKENKIVITETDYQRRYLRPDANRKLVDDAIRLAFGSSPMVFVGSNMGEDDLLRPLRQFMSGVARVGDRVAIALVPAMTDRARRTEEKIALLGRYGVYAIHFGNCRFGKPQNKALGSPPDLSGQVELEWLAWYWSLQKSACEVLKFLSSTDVIASSLAAEYETADEAWSELKKAYSDELQPTPAARASLDDEATESAALADLIELQRTLARAPLSNVQTPRFELREPAEIEGKEVRQDEPSATAELAVEIKLFNGILNWLATAFPRTCPAFSEVQSASRLADAKTAKALLLALEGAGDSVLAIFTCARLDKVKRDWDDWKTNWFSRPVPALPDRGVPASPLLTECAKSPGIVSNDAMVLHRHQIDMRARPHEDPKEGRFYRGAPSQSSYALIEALGSDAGLEFRRKRGRRFLVLLSRRGVGKGHFFSSLGDCEGCAPGISADGGSEPRTLELLRALNPPGAFQQSQWTGLAFLGMSFSQEVMSVFDRLTTFLFERLRGVNPTLADTLSFDRLKNDRIESLRCVLAGWARHGVEQPEDRRRVLIAFSSFGIFYDQKGREKNGQVKRLCDILFSDRYATAPLDFILVCQNDRLPTALIGPEASRAPIALLPDANDSKALARAERALKEVGIGPRGVPRMARPGLELNWSNTPANDEGEAWKILRVRATADEGPKYGADREPSVAVHVMVEARAVVIAAAYFPRVASFMARNSMYSVLRENLASEQSASLNGSGAGAVRYEQSVLPELETHGGVFEPHARNSRDQMRIAFNRLQDSSSKVKPKHFAPVVITLVAMIQEFGDSNGEDPAADIIKQFSDLIIDGPAPPIGESRPEERCIAAAREILKRRIKDASATTGRGGCATAGEYLGEIFSRVVGRFDSDMLELFQRVGEGRYLLTIVLAAAHESTSTLTDESAKIAKQSGPDARLPMALVSDIAGRMMSVVNNISLALKGVPKSARSNVVIEEVLSTMRRRADRGDPLPIVLDWLGQPSDVDKTWASMKPLLHKLMMEIIWHLSIIGQPVERVVLECCPRVLAACQPIVEHKWGGQEISAAVCIREALVLATNRGLIYRLAANPVTAAKEAGATLENTVRYTVHRLVQRYVFRSLGATSSEFTDADQFTLTLFASQPDDLPRLSVEAHQQISGVIAALSDYPGGPANPEQLTLADRDYASMDPSDKRRRLRATLGIMRSIYSVAVLSRFDRRADDKGEELLSEGFFEEHRRSVRWLLKAGADLTQDSPDQSPFYSEEVVWLCNECAVLSTVEGRLADAQALFTLALDAVREIEHDDGGPLHVRLNLNRAVCDIERGHGDDARVALERIAAITDEHPVPPLLARGYLGLIEHLAGEVAQAEANYRVAVTGLAKLGRSRAASIFSRHYGDMLSGLRQPRADEGYQLIDDAIHFAQEGGHEDIRYLALLSLAKCHIRKSDSVDGASIHKELDSIEAYGRAVGLPRILCEVALTRARLLLRQGETERAGTLVNECLEIASMNDLRLRKVSGLLLLAEINLQRNQRQAARPLLAIGIQMAKALNSHFSLTHAQSLQRQLDAELGAGN